MRVAKTKTIEALEKCVWPEPDYPSALVTTCHRLRKKPIGDFTTEDLRVMIGQDIGTQYLMPVAIALLEKDPLAEGDFYPGDLLKNVVTVPEQYWEAHPEQHRQVLAIASRLLARLEQMPAEDAPPRVLARALREFEAGTKGK